MAEENDMTGSAEQIAKNVRLIALERVLAIVQAVMIPVTLAAGAWLISSVIALKTGIEAAAKQTDMVMVTTRVTSLEKATDESKEAVQEARQRRDQQYLDTIQRLTRLEEQARANNDLLTRLLADFNRRSEMLRGTRKAQSDR
jgi:uncharacterized membrane protein (DUF106 family)